MCIKIIIILNSKARMALIDFIALKITAAQMHSWAGWMAGWTQFVNITPHYTLLDIQQIQRGANWSDKLGCQMGCAKWHNCLELNRLWWKVLEYC